MFLKIKHVHFIGIGGIGMSGLAELLHNLGLQVSGSDAAESENTLHLRAVAPNRNGENITITIGHHPDNIRSVATAGANRAVPSNGAAPSNRAASSIGSAGVCNVEAASSRLKLAEVCAEVGAGMCAGMCAEVGAEVGAVCDAQGSGIADVGGTGPCACPDDLEKLPMAVVYSSAIRPDNPELVAARNSLVPVIPRAEILAELMRRKHGIAVAGTHGKTTTTAMISAILTHAGLDPTIVIGGRLASLAGSPCGGINARLGQGDFLIAEADESDGSFLKLSPTIAVVTTLDEEHMEYYGSLDKLKAAFLDFINKVPFYGSAVLCLDQENILDLVSGIQRRYIGYGLAGCRREGEGSGLQPDLTATAIKAAGLRSSFEVVAASPQGKKQGFRDLGIRVLGETASDGSLSPKPLQPKPLSSKGHTVEAASSRLKGIIGQIVLNVPGIHNIYNALAATAVARELDIPFDTIRDALASFQGADRRFQIKAHINNTYVVDDYGHHPTEVKATLATAKGVLATEGQAQSQSEGQNEGQSEGQSEGQGSQDNVGAGPCACPRVLSSQARRRCYCHSSKSTMRDRRSFVSSARKSGSGFQPLEINGCDRRLIVIFQPHRYTRTRDLLTEFFTAFYQSDVLIITDIYSAGEEPIEGIHARLMAEGVKRHGHKEGQIVHYISDKEDVPVRVMEMARPGDMILTLGAGDIWKINPKIVTMIEEKFS